jgi:hypothetical protein
VADRSGNDGRGPEENGTVRQIVYISTAAYGVSADPAAILATSRRNNARDRVTGLLWFDGKRFLQALEGEEEVVDRTFRRIQADPRHRALVVLSSRTIAEREFGEWAMDHRAPGVDPDRAVERIGRLAANAAPEVRATFESFTRVRRAA